MANFSAQNPILLATQAHSPSGKKLTPSADGSTELSPLHRNTHAAWGGMIGAAIGTPITKPASATSAAATPTMIQTHGETSLQVFAVAYRRSRLPSLV